jgi:hypothetical protein
MIRSSVGDEFFIDVHGTLASGAALDTGINRFDKKLSRPSAIIFVKHPNCGSVTLLIAVGAIN